MTVCRSASPCITERQVRELDVIPWMSNDRRAVSQQVVGDALSVELDLRHGAGRY